MIRPVAIAAASLMVFLSGPAIALEESDADARAADVTVKVVTSVVPLMGQLDVRFEGLRSKRGVLRACLTQDRTHFPKCEKDPAAITGSVAAGDHAQLLFSRVPPGDYALLVFHDENSNSRLDTMLGIPREGVGFSRNPRIRFGAPGFDAVILSVSPGAARETAVKLQYFL